MREGGRTLALGLGTLQDYDLPALVVRAIQRIGIISLTFLKETKLRLHVVWRGWMTLYRALSTRSQLRADAMEGSAKPCREQRIGRAR